MTRRAWRLAFGVCAFISACGSSNTTPTPAGYAGLWNGTTSQGAAISFSVSSDEKVTAITLGHNFNGCSGVETFSNLNLDTAPNVTCIPGPCSPGLLSYRAFGYSSGPREGPATSVNAVFLSTTRAEGSAGFRDYPGCGTAIGVGWLATKR